VEGEGRERERERERKGRRGRWTRLPRRGTRAHVAYESGGSHFTRTDATVLWLREKGKRVGRTQERERNLATETAAVTCRVLEIEQSVRLCA
jgi:hypothetical protein